MARARTSLLLVPVLFGCTTPAIRPAPAPAPALELVESWPSGTSLDHPDLRDASEVWPEMIRGAKRTLDIAEFYVSDEPGSRLSPVLAAVEDAARRGVKVRVLAEESFYKTYPESLDRLARTPNTELRRYNLKALTGGVLHAKYFIVDGEEAYVGSQNFDWRSLEHIQELGVWIRSRAETAALQDVFDTDWALAGGAEPSTRIDRSGPSAVVASPKGWLPDESAWDLPRLLAMIDGARKTVRVQLMTYRAKGRGGEPLELDAALRRAAARGVKVELMVADWTLRPGTLPSIQALEPVVAVKFVTIPQAPGAFIPFARVIHAKYLVVDGERAWIGTSNWEPSYFHDSRNVGLILEGGDLPPRLDRFFLDLWDGPYAERLDPAKQYTPPRVAE